MNKETIAAILIYLVYGTLSYLFSRAYVRSKSNDLSISLVAAYWFGTFAYFLLLANLFEEFQDHKIYFEFGHAHIELFGMFALCLLVTTVNTGFTIWYKGYYLKD